MNRLLFASALLLISAVQAPDSNLREYLRIRKSYGIVESVGVAALETLVGTRTFEVQGVVKGTIGSGNRLSILVERTDGTTLSIDAAKAPDWAVGTEVMARLIVRATRAEADEEMHATLIAIATDEDVRPYEIALEEAAAKRAKAMHKTYAPSHSDLKSLYAVAAKGRARRWVVPSDDAWPYYASFIQHHNRKLSSTEAKRMALAILGYSKMYGVDAPLIVAMVICESDFNPTEVSNKGAMGLGQLMPETVQDYGITDPFDSVQNLYGTVREIRGHIDRYRAQTGDEYQALVLALAGYNAGDGAVKRHNGVPPYRETQAYVRKVIKLYAQLIGYK